MEMYCRWIVEIHRDVPLPTSTSVAVAIPRSLSDNKHHLLLPAEELCLLFFTIVYSTPISLFSKAGLLHCNDMQSVIVSFQFQITGIYFQTGLFKTHYRDVHRDIRTYSTVHNVRRLPNAKRSWYALVISCQHCAQHGGKVRIGE